MGSVVDLSRMLQHRGKHADALAFSRCALHHRGRVRTCCRLEIARRDHGAGAPALHTAALLADHACICMHLGSRDRAIEVVSHPPPRPSQTQALRRELEVRAPLGDTWDVVRCLDALAVALQHSRADEAELLLRRALAVSQACTVAARKCN